MRALVIDDSRMIRKALRQILTPMGFDVIEAEHGRQGLQRLQEFGQPDVILCDWNMPEMDGITFLRTIRQEQRYAHLCVLMVTTMSEMEQVVTALEAGATEYIMKPFTPDVIKDKLSMIGISVA